MVPQQNALSWNWHQKTYLVKQSRSPPTHSNPCLTFSNETVRLPSIIMANITKVTYTTMLRGAFSSYSNGASNQRRLPGQSHCQTSPEHCMKWWRKTSSFQATALSALISDPIPPIMPPQLPTSQLKTYSPHARHPSLKPFIPPIRTATYGSPPIWKRKGGLSCTTYMTQ